MVGVMFTCYEYLKEQLDVTWANKNKIIKNPQFQIRNWIKRLNLIIIVIFIVHSFALVQQ